jgi:hypothetical protein
MSVSDRADPELLGPWHEIDVQYDFFQEWAFQHEETANVVSVEQEMGPFDNGLMRYQIVLLPPDYQEGEPGVEPLNTVEDGFNTKEEALHEAEALMATGVIDE